MEDEETNRRKAKLRCHQPPPPSCPTYYPPQRLMPLNIQSASTSPHEMHMHVASEPTLPHFHDTVWTRPNNNNPAVHIIQDHSPHEYPACNARTAQPQPQYSASPIPSAPFANAGPPGFQFYTTPIQQQPSPLHNYNWSRGRRL